MMPNELMDWFLMVISVLSTLLLGLDLGLEFDFYLTWFLLHHFKWKLLYRYLYPSVFKGWNTQ